MTQRESISRSSTENTVTIRRVREEDLDDVVSLDERVTDIAKPDYWRDIFDRYATRRVDERFFLVAENTDQESGPPILGFIVGEVRTWEFGSRPCGWVFAFSVDSGTRLKGVGKQLYTAISEEFKAVGIEKMRTMVGRKNQLLMAFFRSEGMIAGPYLQLEKDLND